MCASASASVGCGTDSDGKSNSSVCDSLNYPREPHVIFTLYSPSLTANRAKSIKHGRKRERGGTSHEAPSLTNDSYSPHPSLEWISVCPIVYCLGRVGYGSDSRKQATKSESYCWSRLFISTTVHTVASRLQSFRKRGSPALYKHF